MDSSQGYFSDSDARLGAWSSPELDIVLLRASLMLLQAQTCTSEGLLSEDPSSFEP